MALTNNHPADLVEAVARALCCGTTPCRTHDGKCVMHPVHHSLATAALDAIQAYMAQPEVLDVDREAASDFLKSWPRSAFASYIEPALAEAFARHRTQATVAAQARIAELKKALVTAVIPLEAMILSGTYRSMCPEMQQGVIDGVKSVRAALAKIGDV